MHGPVTFQNAELDDLIIARADGTPTYNFCVVVDDIDMGITHVIRGDDHLNNTPRQMNMLRALGATLPVYAHVPMILGPDGAKLSKRHGAVSVLQYQEEGYLPDALLNYLVRLGWSHGDQEIFTREELIAAFDIHDVNKAASAFNPEKLLWLNQQHMMRAAPAALGPTCAHSCSASGSTAATRVCSRAYRRPARARQDPEGDGAQQPFLLSPSRSSLIPRPRQAPGRRASRSPWARCVSGWRRSRTGTRRDHAALNELATQLGSGLGNVAQPLRVAVTGTAVPADRCDAALLGRGAAGRLACGPVVDAALKTGGSQGCLTMPGRLRSVRRLFVGL